jgi:hypothetical protein
MAENANLRLVHPAPRPKPRGVQIASDFVFPLDVITQSLAIVAQRGSGKTYLAKKMLEGFLWNGLATVVIDLMGVFHGIRSSADGERAGYKIPIFGGLHGDAPLDASMGRALAAWVCGGESQPRSCVLDISHLMKSDQHLLICEFGEALYHLNQRALHIVLDEADFFAPQRFQKGVEQRLFNVFDAIVRRGRVKGFGITMITQRPAVLNKDVLTQVGALIMLRLGSPHDQKAVRAWIEWHDSRVERERVLGSLAGLPIGTAWVWSPGWLKALRRIRVGVQQTWDSSSTPKRGEPLKLARVRSEINVEALRSEVEACMATVGGAWEGGSQEIGNTQAAKRPRKPRAKSERESEREGRDR